MASTNVRFTSCDIDLNVEITPLPDLNTDVHGTIIIGNKILFKFEDNKKQILF
jgi:hypothetical protein